MGAGGGDERACATSSTLSKRSMSAFLIWSTKSCVAPLPSALVRTDASRDGPELSHHTQGVGDRPALHDLAVPDVVDLHARHHYLIAGRSDDHLLYGETDVGEGLAVHADQLLDALRTDLDLRGVRVVVDVPGGDELVH